MARHYYLTRSGRLRRKDNTLVFELTGGPEPRPGSNVLLNEETIAGGDDAITAFDQCVPDYEMGDLQLEPEDLNDDSGMIAETGTSLGMEEENDTPVKVRERRVIPIEDVDTIWVFHELDLNARVLIFLGQKRIPVHFFNYYGYYAGSFYPREHLQPDI